MRYHQSNYPQLGVNFWFVSISIFKRFRPQTDTSALISGSTYIVQTLVLSFMNVQLIPTWGICLFSQVQSHWAVMPLHVSSDPPLDSLIVAHLQLSIIIPITKLMFQNYLRINLTLDRIIIQKRVFLLHLLSK